MNEELKEKMKEKIVDLLRAIGLILSIVVVGLFLASLFGLIVVCLIALFM